MDQFDPVRTVLDALAIHPTGQPQLDVVAALERAADAFEGRESFFYAGYALDKAVHPAWASGEAIERCVRRALIEYERAVTHAPVEDLAAIAALVSWTVLLGMNYLGDDPTEVGQTHSALSQVLAERLIAFARSGEERLPDPCLVLVYGFRLKTDFRMVGVWSS